MRNHEGSGYSTVAFILFFIVVWVIIGMAIGVGMQAVQ